ncbi:SNO glutamine amidotransferase family protein [Tieghemostelium lacteum]|uniref:glutaminase n=1 Tax=Tieghemostelium lacteum TaxID=361077 RepID=A0A152A280_TIELA|nr:SNO glutamine amidotransferase family protein [Tieghemostelium lacteum]|eukprot:KYR00171.1 SNO glutamine amidotransferase family protein [Tieghemostelium lacteum]
MEVKIGILALQGGFREHKEIIELLAKQENHFNKYTCKEIKTDRDLVEFKPDGIILPGGESTAMSIISSAHTQGTDIKNIFDHLKEFVSNGKPIYGTCAGAIMLSDQVENQKDGGQSLIGGLHIQTSRNYFGRQINSFQSRIRLDLPVIEKSPDESQPSVTILDDIDGVFIRAPGITKILDKSVEILGRYQVTLKDSTKETIITAVKQNNILATVFHPELTVDTRFHKYFIDIVIAHKLSFLK